MSVDTRARAAAAAARGVADRFAVPDPDALLRLRARRRWVRVTVSAICALVAISAIAIPLVGRDEHRVTVASPHRRVAGDAQVGDRYVPATTTAHGTTRMPVTLPDGRPFTVSYAPKLDAAHLGFTAAVTAGLRINQLGVIQRRTLPVLHTTAAQRYSGLTPNATYPNAQGRPMPFYVDPSAPERSGLAVQIGSWLVVVPDLDDPANHPDDHLTPDQLALWAQHLQGWIGDDGFPVLAGDQELSLHAATKDTFVLGPSASRSGSITVGDRQLCEGPGTDTTKPRRFSTTATTTDQGAAWCDRATGLHVAVVGPERFVDGTIASFRIAPFSNARRAARILLSTRTMPSGSSIPGVIVVNNTGSPIDAHGCGSPFMVTLARGRPPAPVEPDCSNLLVFAEVPSGETAYPITLIATSTCSAPSPCALPEGNYHAAISVGLRAFPAAPPIRVQVTPARG